MCISGIIFDIGCGITSGGIHMAKKDKKEEKKLAKKAAKTAEKQENILYLTIHAEKGGD